MPDIRPGESVEVHGSGIQRYVLKNVEGVYSCTCLAWKRQRIPAAQRTCKHLKRFRGEQAESDRLGLSESPEPDAAPPLFLSQPQAIAEAIERLRKKRRIWLDTEVADWQKGNGRLSLIQALPDDCEPHSGATIFLDVLDQPDLAEHFVDQIMTDSSIEKVFHNASFDLRYLGGSDAVNVVCTMRLAKSFPSHVYSFPDGFALKALTQQFGIASNVSKEEQGSDWGVRPLSSRQLRYAALDVVYLRGVHLTLLDMASQLEDPATVSIDEIEARLLPIEDEFRRLKPEVEYLRDLLKTAMDQQGVHQSREFELTRRLVSTMNVSLSDLAELVVRQSRRIDEPIRLTKPILEALGDLADDLESVTAPTQQLTLRRRSEKSKVVNGQDDDNERFG